MNSAFVIQDKSHSITNYNFAYSFYRKMYNRAGNFVKLIRQNTNVHTLAASSIQQIEKKNIVVIFKT